MCGGYGRVAIVTIMLFPWRPCGCSSFRDQVNDEDGRNRCFGLEKKSQKLLMSGLWFALGDRHTSCHIVSILIELQQVGQGGPVPGLNGVAADVQYAMHTLV